MTTKLIVAAALFSVVMGVLAFSQDKAASPSPRRIAAFDLNACFDKAKVAKIKEIDTELAELAEDLTRKAQQAPEEKDKLKAQYIERHNQRKLEIYQVVERVAAEIGRERGYMMVLASTKEAPLQIADKSDSLTSQISRRTVVFCNSEADITPEVLKRLNEALAKPRKNF